MPNANIPLFLVRVNQSGSWSDNDEPITGDEVQRVLRGWGLVSQNEHSDLKGWRGTVL